MGCGRSQRWELRGDPISGPRPPAADERSKARSLTEPLRHGDGRCRSKKSNRPSNRGEPQNPGTSSFFSVPLRLSERPLWGQLTSPPQSFPRRVPQATALSRHRRAIVIVLSDRWESNSTSIVALPPSRAHRTPQSHWRSKAIASGTRKQTIYAVMGRWIAPPTVQPADNLLPQAGKDGLAGRPTR